MAFIKTLTQSTAIFQAVKDTAAVKVSNPEALAKTLEKVSKIQAGITKLISNLATQQQSSTGSSTPENSPAPDSNRRIGEPSGHRP